MLPQRTARARRRSPNVESLSTLPGGPLSGVPFSGFPQAYWCGSILHCSGSCSSVVSGFDFLHQLAIVGLAVSQFVWRLGCWVVGVLRWSQPLPEFAVRQEPGRALKFWFVTWIWCRRVVRTVADLNGAQFAIDTTLVSPVRRDGLPSPPCIREDGAALTIARR